MRVPVLLMCMALAACGADRDAPAPPDAAEKAFLNDAAEMLPNAPASPAPDVQPDAGAMDISPSA